MDWCFVVMYLTGFESVFMSGVKHSWCLLGVSAAYLFAVYGWDKSRKLNKKHDKLNGEILSTNNDLVKLNEDLISECNKKDGLIQGLISETNELKYKLKNAKMESARLRNKGGRRDE